MSALKKATILASVTTSPLAKRRMLRDLGVPKSTYYRWLRLQQHHQGLEDRPGVSTPPWNRLRSQEERSILEAAREMPELSSRQLAAWTTDNLGFAVSESTVYRILRREGLVKSPEMQLKASQEYHRKTTGPHQMWATDASYFKVIGWGYYYLVTVMDDYSRFILSWKLAAGHDYRLSHRGGPGGCRQDWHDRGPGGRPDQLALGQRLRICVPWLQRLPAPGGNQAHPGCTLPPSDQRQAGALSPDYQERRQAGPLRDGFRSGGCPCRLRGLLQLQALSQGAGQCDTCRCAPREAGTDTAAQEGGAGSHNRTAKALQQDPQGAHQALSPISNLSGLKVSHFRWLPTVASPNSPISQPTPVAPGPNSSQCSERCAM